MQYILDQKEYDNMAGAFKAQIKVLEDKLANARKDEQKYREDLLKLFQVQEIHVSNNPTIDDPFTDVRKTRVTVRYIYDDLPSDFKKMVDSKINSRQDNFGPR